LIWGITDQNPLQRRAQLAQPAPPPREAQNPATAAIESLADHLRTTGNITFFLGRSIAYPPSNSDITSELLSQLGMIDAASEGLLPPLDLAASFFAVEHGDISLENEVVDMISQRKGAMPESYGALARLQKALSAREAIRGKDQYKQLIISNNLDVLLEKALLLEGVPFTRLVQLRSSSRVQVNTVSTVQKLASGKLQVCDPTGLVGDADPNDDAALGDLISRSGVRTVYVNGGIMCDDKAGKIPTATLVSAMVEPILFKLHGSQDVAKSCAISTEQYFDTLWRSIDQKCIPDQLATIISNTPLVLVGSRILDADFRLSYTLLRTSLESGTDQDRFAVLPRAPGDGRDGSHRLTMEAWDKLSVMALKKYSIQMLDEREDVFFRRLADAFASHR